MKIGFDVSQTSEEKAGCGFFADQLIRRLVETDQTNDYLLYPTFYNYRNPNQARCAMPASGNCTMHFKGMSFKEVCAGWDAKMPDRTAWLGNPDIVHSNNFSCFKDHNARIVYTLYDVSLIVHPEVTTEANRVACFEGLFNASLFADHCIAISQFTKKSFLQYFPHYPEDRITVAHLGTRPSIRKISDGRIIDKVLGKFSLSRENYWLGVGTIEPRKNYRLLMDAYCAHNDGKPLVIAGGKGWLESDIGDKIRALGMEDKIRFVGYVSDDELSVLYSTCFAFIYPSLYEGFGLPVLEAMNCGAAVITSDTSSLPEVGEDAVLYIDPLSSDTLIDKMHVLTRQERVLRELRTKSQVQAGRFSWEKTAKTVLSVYDRVSHEHDTFKFKSEV